MRTTELVAAVRFRPDDVPTTPRRRLPDLPATPAPSEGRWRALWPSRADAERAGTWGDAGRDL